MLSGLLANAGLIVCLFCATVKLTIAWLSQQGIALQKTLLNCIIMQLIMLIHCITIIMQITAYYYAGSCILLCMIIAYYYA